MTEATLDKNKSRLVGGLTIAAAQRLGGETFMIEEDNGVRQLQMARAGDVVLLDHRADATRLRSINAYLVEAQDFAAAAPSGEGKKFKLNPRRLLYSLQWLHNGTPPDFQLQLVRDPAIDAVSLALFAELAKYVPELRDRLRTARPTENGKDGPSTGPRRAS